MSCLLKADSRKSYPVISHGKGVRLYDTNGRSYIDGSSGAIVANIGHGVPEILTAAHDQIARIAYTYRTQFTNDPAEQLAAKIIARAPGKSAAFFFSSGSEATEAAIRLALQYWREQGRPQKRRVLSRQVSYHGNTLGALSLSSDGRRRSMHGLLFTEPTVSPCYCYRCPHNASPESCALPCADDLEKSIHEIGSDQIAALIVEPVIGATGGAVVPHSQYMPRLREICDRHDILLIADEVITGFGRTGRWFGMDHWDVKSDMTILGKGLNGGYTPLSAILLSEHVVGAIKTGSAAVDVGHTHSGNPLSAAICGAVIDYIESNSLVENAARLGPMMESHLNDLARKHALIGDVRGLGLLWGMELVADRMTRAPFDQNRALTRQLVEHAFDHGLVVYPCRGLMADGRGDAILVAPPLTINPLELLELIDRLDAALTELANSP